MPDLAHARFCRGRRQARFPAGAAYQLRPPLPAPQPGAPRKRLGPASARPRASIATRTISCMRTSRRCSLEQSTGRVSLRRPAGMVAAGAVPGLVAGICRTDKPVAYVSRKLGADAADADGLEALADQPVTLVRGHRRPRGRARAPGNVHVADYSAGSGSGGRANLVICNGGSPATSRRWRRGARAGRRQQHGSVPQHGEHLPLRRRSGAARQQALCRRAPAGRARAPGRAPRGMGRRAPARLLPAAPRALPRALARPARQRIKARSDR